MIGPKLSKSTLVTLALLGSLSPALAQDKVDTVHISQPRTQDLGGEDSWASKKGNRGSNSSAAGSGAMGTGGGLGTGGSGMGGSFNRNGKNSNNSNNNNSSTGGPGGYPLPGGPSGSGGPGNAGGPGGPGGPGNPFHPTHPNPPVTNNPPVDPFNPNDPSNPNNPNNPNNPGFPPDRGGGGGSIGNTSNGGSGLASPALTAMAAANSYPAGAAANDTSIPGGTINHNNGQITNPQNPQLIPGQTWPFHTAPFMAQMGPVSGSSQGNSIFGKQIPAGLKSTTPPSAAQFAAITSITQEAAIESLFQPASWLQTAKEVQNTQTQANADNAANMEKQQAGCAIDFVRSSLENFTVDAGNQWNKLRNELFMPMAILLLLPGAIATQAKATVAQGFPLFGETSPVEGIYRSIVAIFLIPGTYLIVNYGIDVSNSIAYSIQSEYYRIFGTDMYRDAMCAHIRAFGARLPAENLGHIPQDPAQMQPTPGAKQSPRTKFEGNNTNVKIEDPCAGIYQAPESKANEKVPYAVNTQRAGYNGMGAGLAMTWNILCAFQMCYLYYLWFVGPIMAALWVWPVKQLRDAFPNWCEGVITICFWSLFWNTTVLLMACFRGIDDTGTVIMEALNFLSTACVKFAFDFAGLVKAAGQKAGEMAEKGAGGSSKGSSGSGAAGRNSSGKPSHAPAPNSDRKPSLPTSAQASGNLGTTGSSGISSSNVSTLPRASETAAISNSRSTSDKMHGPPIPGSMQTESKVAGLNLGPTNINLGASYDSPDSGPPPLNLAALNGPQLAVPSAGQFSNSVESRSLSFDGVNEAQRALSRENREHQQGQALSMAEDQKKQQQEQAMGIAQQHQNDNILNTLNNLNSFNPNSAGFIASLGANANAPVPSAPGTDSNTGNILRLNNNNNNNQDNYFNTGSGAGFTQAGTVPLVPTTPSNFELQSSLRASLDPAAAQQQFALNSGVTQAQSAATDFGRSVVPDANTYNTVSNTQPSNQIDLGLQANPAMSRDALSQYIDPNSIAPQSANNAQDPRIVDLPAAPANRITVDAAQTDSSPQYARESYSQADDYLYGTGYTNPSSFSTDAALYNNAGNYSSSVERASESAANYGAAEIPYAINAASQAAQANAQAPEQAIVYRQKEQETIIEERRPSNQARRDGGEQARKSVNQNQKYLDQQRLNQGRPGSAPPPAQSSALPPGQRPVQQRSSVPGQPAQALPNQNDSPSNETQNRANASLQEQVQMGSILRRSRSTNDMSEEEIELMKKLGQSEDENQQPG